MGKREAPQWELSLSKDSHATDLQSLFSETPPQNGYS